jgi:hypothetical protein
VNIMKLVSALVGLAALGGVALSSTAASASSINIPVSATGIVVPTGYVCNEWGHCWHRHSYYGGGYYHPHYWGGYGWHRRWGGYGSWHHSWGHDSWGHDSWGHGVAYGWRGHWGGGWGGYGWHPWHQW